MATFWEWDSFDERVRIEADAIREGKQLTSLGQKRGILTLDLLLKASMLLKASESAWQGGDEVRAIASLLVAVRMDSSCWQAYSDLGWRYLTIGERWHQAFVGRVRLTDGQSYIKSLFERTAFYENAVRQLGTALRLYPKNARGWYLLGHAQFYLGEYDLAHASLWKAFELDPLGKSGTMAKESLEIFDSSLAWATVVAEPAGTAEPLRRRRRDTRGENR